MKEQLQSLISEILDIPAQQVRDDMLRSQTAAWDSMTHLRLVTAVEQEFGATLSMDEIVNIETPAQLEEAIERATH